MHSAFPMTTAEWQRRHLSPNPLRDARWWVVERRYARARVVAALAPAITGMAALADALAALSDPMRRTIRALADFQNAVERSQR